MWISLADSIHKIILIIVKIFDIKSSLPRTPTLPLQSQSFLIFQLSIRYINHFRIYSLFTWSLVSLLVSIILNQFISEQFIFFPSLVTPLSLFTTVTFLLGIFPTSSSTFSLLQFIWPRRSFIAVPSILVQHILLHL